MKEPVLFLVHRIPFPPNKGDKIRSYHLLRHLSARHDVHLGTFVDMQEDFPHVSRIETLCASVHVEALVPLAARLRSALGFLTGEALTLPYYRAASMQSWVRDVVRGHGIRKAVVFSAAMAQYVRDIEDLRVVVDFVDVDSAKWSEYAARRTWPSSTVFRREGEKLFDFERSIAGRAAASVFVTPREAQLFLDRAPEMARCVHVIENGVDTDFFAPESERPSPYGADETAVVFTGAMDYWPNIDAVTWFATEVLPRIAARRAGVRFYIVGMNPAPAVVALASPNVVVTGTVPDVRPYLQHAAAVVAPLRVARGIQNKVLEAMSMARPVVASVAAGSSLGGVKGRDLEVAESPEDFAAKVGKVLEPAVGAEMGRRGRQAIVSGYSWARNLAAFDELLQERAATSACAVR